MYVLKQLDINKNFSETKNLKNKYFLKRVPDIFEYLKHATVTPGFLDMT